MVVSVDSQKIIKKSRHKSRGIQDRRLQKKRQYKSKRVSSEYRKKDLFRISRRPVSLFMMPFITSLFIFSIYINISDSLWQVESPEFTVVNLKFPDDSDFLPDEYMTMKGSFDLYFLMPSQKDAESIEGVLKLSTYTVREDDRYSIIAEKFHISIDSLLSVNRIGTGNIPVAGGQIEIPNLSGIYYTVQKGDTLTSISSRFALEIEDIRHVNQLYSTVIHIGEELYLPGISLDRDKLNRIVGNRFIIPATGSVKNTYGSSIDPTTGLKNYNYGIDIINTKGTAVYAARDGIVKNTSYNSYFGRVVLLNHSGSFQSMYACLESVTVEQGQYVLQGDLLGYMGNSGFKSNDHLQFSIFKNKEDVDTLEYIF